MADEPVPHVHGAPDAEPEADCPQCHRDDVDFATSLMDWLLAASRVDVAPASYRHASLRLSLTPERTVCAWAQAAVFAALLADDPPPTAGLAQWRQRLLAQNQRDEGWKRILDEIGALLTSAPDADMDRLDEHAAQIMAMCDSAQLRTTHLIFGSVAGLALSAKLTQRENIALRMMAVHQPRMLICEPHLVLAVARFIGSVADNNIAGRAHYIRLAMTDRMAGCLYVMACALHGCLDGDECPPLFYVRDDKQVGVDPHGDLAAVDDVEVRAAMVTGRTMNRWSGDGPDAAFAQLHADVDADTEQAELVWLLGQTFAGLLAQFVDQAYQSVPDGHTAFGRVHEPG